MTAHPIDRDSRGYFCLVCPWPEGDFSSNVEDARAHQEDSALLGELEQVRAMPENDGDTEQLALPLMSVVQTPTHDDPDLTIQERFEAFHAANRWIFYSFVSLTEDWLAQGNKRASIGMFTEVLRHRYGRIIRGQTFKINNNYRSRYVRKLIEEHPEWDAVFETRELRSK